MEKAHRATRHAVLTDTSLVSIAQTERKLITRAIDERPRNLAEVYELARKTDCTDIWVMPGTGYDYSPHDFTKPVDGYDIRVNYDDVEKTVPRSASIVKPGTYGIVRVMYPHRGRFQWEVQKPVDVLSTIDYLSTQLKIPVQWSPGWMAFETIRKEHSSGKHQEWVREASMDMYALPFMKAARDVLWPLPPARRPSHPLTATHIGWYLHVYDKNSAFLASCTNANVGCGDPVYVDRCTDTTKPGIYRVTVNPGSSRFDNVQLPYIIDPTKGQQWVTRNVLAFAQQRGYEVQVQDAYQFNEQHQILRQWAEDLWEVRYELDPKRGCNPLFPCEAGRLNAYHTVKEIACMGVGKLGSKHYDHQFKRPNWWADVVGRTRETVLYALAKYRDMGHTPVIAYADAIGFVSRNPDPRTAVPGILDREGKLGGYKVAYAHSIQVTPELVDVYQNGTASATIGYLNTLWGKA